MALRTKFPVSRAGFVCDWESVQLLSGRQIDWASVSSAYLDTATGFKHIPGGSVMVEFNAGQPNAGKIVPWPSGTQPANTTIIGLLVSDADEAPTLNADSLSGYGVMAGAIVYEALLPDSTGTPRALPTAVKTALNTAGRTSFRFETYNDNTAG